MKGIPNLINNLENFISNLRSEIRYCFRLSLSHSPSQYLALLIHLRDIDEHVQESALTIMHCQHDNGFSLVVLLLKFFSFLPHMLQRFIFCFILKRILLFDVAAILNPPVLQIVCRFHLHLYYSSTASSFLQ